MPRVRKGKNCSAKCLTRDHKTFGECMRAKGIQLNPNLSDSQTQRNWDRELDNYEKAVSNGLQPEGTSQAAVDRAWAEAEA